MGVPQCRHRVFFIASRIDLNFPKIKLNFNEPSIPLKEAFAKLDDRGEGKPLTSSFRRLWDQAKPGVSYSKYHETGSFFSNCTADPQNPANTLTSSRPARPIRWEAPECFSDEEVICIQSFPGDYDFIEQSPQYVCGMSVPPFMMQRIAVEIEKQWLGVKNENTGT
jgi:DNA (cytosine-5)-methyltransferase 1